MHMLDRRQAILKTFRRGLRSESVANGSITIWAPIALYGGGANLETALYWQHGISAA
jgi:hypothetical protein